MNNALLLYHELVLFFKRYAVNYPNICTFASFTQNRLKTTPEQFRLFIVILLLKEQLT